MKLSIIFPILNQHELAEVAIDWATRNLSGETDVEVIMLDNGSEPAFQKAGYLARLSKNIGVYPTFWEALKFAKGDVLAFFHSDLIVTEKGWDKRVMDQFINNPNLGLLGFIGSNEIDSGGGRGYGTTSNFQGDQFANRDALGSERIWRGSPAQAHGARNSDFTKAAVVDGCAMIFRREVLEKIKQREQFPPHHFYDRLLSCETREAGYQMGVLGIACDHISGQTVNQEPAYDKMAQEWAEAHGLLKGSRNNWDSVLYQEAEKQWLTEYRDEKHLVPCKV